MKEKNNYRENVRLHILWPLKKIHFFTSKIARRNEETERKVERKDENNLKSVSFQTEIRATVFNK